MPDAFQHSDGDVTWLVLDAGTPGEWMAVDARDVREVDP